MQNVFVVDCSSDVTTVHLEEKKSKVGLPPGHHPIPIECMHMLHDDILQPGMDRKSIVSLMCRLIAIGYDQEIARRDPNEPFPKLKSIRLGERNERTLELLLSMPDGIVINGVAATSDKNGRTFERLLLAGRIAAETKKAAAA